MAFLSSYKVYEEDFKGNTKKLQIPYLLKDKIKYYIKNH